MIFRLTTLLWFFAVVAASLAVFGAWGVLVAAIVLWLWDNKVREPKPWFTWAEIAVIVAIVGILIALLLPAVQSAGSGRRSMTANAMRQLMLAIHNYADVRGHMPAPYVKDEANKPLYSWRVTVWPYVGGNNLRSGWFHFDESWNSRHNRQLLKYAEEFQSPAREVDKNTPGETHFLAIVDNETAWAPDATVAFNDITDGTSNTIVLIEAAGQGIAWTEPRELTLEQAIDLLTGGGEDRYVSVDERYFASKKYAIEGAGWRCVAFADGHVEYLGPLKNRADARALLTRAGGESIPENLEELEIPYSHKYVSTIIHWERIWGVAFWLVVVLLPLHPAARRKIFPSTAHKAATIGRGAEDDTVTS